MEELDINHYMQICFKHNIKVYPIIYDANYLKIQVDYSGRKKTGTEKYNWRTEQTKLQEKIQELYERIANNL